MALNTGDISNEGSTIGQAVESDLKGKEALIITFWNSFEDHEESHKSDTFQPLFEKVVELCENGNEEIAYDMLWSGAAYSTDQIAAAKEAKLKLSMLMFLSLTNMPLWRFPRMRSLKISAVVLYMQLTKKIGPSVLM